MIEYAAGMAGVVLIRRMLFLMFGLTVIVLIAIINSKDVSTMPTPVVSEQNILLPDTPRSDPMIVTRSGHFPGSPALHPTQIPYTAFYVWCGKRQFKFHHYLSVKSTIHFLNPDNLIVFYQDRPKVDPPFRYNTWFNEIIATYPFITAIQMEEKQNMCGANSVPERQAIVKFLQEHGGLYVGENVLLTQTPSLNNTVINRLPLDTRNGILLAAPGQQTELLSDAGQPSCTSLTDMNTANVFDDLCIRLNMTFYPKDIWYLDTTAGAFFRTVFYGSPKIHLPVKNSSELVPNVAHLIWTGGGEMNFLFYLDVLSLIYVVKVDNVYIHGEKKPAGPLWAKLQNETKLIWRYRNVMNITTIFGNPVKGASHWSDVLRYDILLKYGGIYVDTDAIFMKPFSNEVRSYEAVATYSIAQRGEYPDSVVPGMMLAKPGAPFIRAMQNSMKLFLDDNHFYNPLQVPYKIMERNPGILHIDPHIQVVCTGIHCQPTWVPQYKGSNRKQVKGPLISDWQKETNTYHFHSHTVASELKTEENLRTFKGQSIFADMGRYILQKAGRTI